MPENLTVNRFFIKSPVFPFAKFPGVDPILSPEMHSTGEVMGVGETFGEAYGKAMTARRTVAARKGHGFHQRQRCGQRTGGDAGAQAGAAGF